MALHELGAEFFGAVVIVDVDLEIVFERLKAKTMTILCKGGF